MVEGPIICVGYSRLPDGMAAKSLYGAMGVGFEVDVTTKCIINTSATFVTDMCNSFIGEIFNGHNLDEGVDRPIEIFERRYFGMGKKAIISAIHDAYNQYLTYKELELSTK